MTAALALHGITVQLGGRTVLDDLDLDVGAGEWVNVIGPNGAGKTTLLRAVLGSVVRAGSVVIDGAEGRADARSLARSIAYVPQTPVIPPGVPVVDYVLLGRTPHRGAFAAHTDHDVAVVAAVLDRLDLHGMAERPVTTLSGGERQRAVLARALAQQAPILLLDEPTTALDLGHQQAVLDLVEDLRRESGLTVVATLHDLTLAARYGDRVALLAEGRVACDGPPAAVLTQATILEHFNARVRVLDEPDGPVIVPAAAPNKVATP